MRFAPINTYTFLRVLDALAWRNGSTVQQIAHFSGFGVSTARNAVNNAAAFGLVSLGKEGQEQQVRLIEEFRPKLSPADQLALIRTRLQHWDFFQAFCEFLSLGNKPSAAARKAGVIVGVKVEFNDIAALLSLAADAGLLRKDAGEFRLAASIPAGPTTESISISTVDLDTEMSAILFVSNRLGSALFHSLDQTEQSRLTQAIRVHASNPEKSCEDAGKALESYLRLIGTRAGHDLTRLQGLGQIADYLAGAERMTIHPKHRDMIKATSSLRNCSAHERDKITNEPWQKTPEIALANVLWTLHLIVSLSAWVSSRAQTI